MKVLVVKNQKSLRDLLADGFRAASKPVVHLPRSGELRDSDAGFAVLDPELPGGDRADLLREWREAGFGEPVLILSACDMIQERGRGSPGFPELVARIQSLLCRPVPASGNMLVRGKLKMDPMAHLVMCDDRPVQLTRREFALLEFLLRHPGRTLSREQICKQVWKKAATVNPNLLDVYMSSLRTKLDRDPAKPVFRTVRGVGYQLL